MTTMDLPGQVDQSSKTDIRSPDTLHDPTGHGHPSRGREGYVTLTLGDEHLDIWDLIED